MNFYIHWAILFKSMCRGLYVKCIWNWRAATAFVIRTPVEALRKSTDSELMLFRIYLIKRDRRDSPMGNTATHTYIHFYTPHTHTQSLTITHSYTLTHTQEYYIYIGINLNVLNPCRSVLRYAREYMGFIHQYLTGIINNKIINK